MVSRATVFVALLTTMHRTAAFAPSSSTFHRGGILSPSNVRPVSNIRKLDEFTTRRTPTSALSMNYGLPPSPKGPLDDLQSILPTIATGVLVALFFASPLGAAFFALFNSLFVLSLLLPFILFVGFQVWSALYTLEAPCPSCGQIPIRALKNGEPSVCLNCGAFSRVNQKGDGLEICNNSYDILNEGMGGGSLFDALFGGNGMSDFGVTDTTNGVGKTSNAKRQSKIIDVEVERDDD